MANSSKIFLIHFQAFFNEGCYFSSSWLLFRIYFIKSNNEFTIYPNPTSNILNIKTKHDIKNVVIYNVQGQQVLVGKNKSVNVSNLALGIYLLKVETTNGSFTTKRFIKQ